MQQHYEWKCLSPSGIGDSPRTSDASQPQRGQCWLGVHLARSEGARQPSSRALLRLVTFCAQFLTGLCLLHPSAGNASIPHLYGYVTQSTVEEFEQLCRSKLVPQGAVCVPAPDVEHPQQRLNPWNDIRHTSELREALARHGKERVQYRGMGLPVFIGYYRQRQNGEWLTRVYAFSSLQTLNDQRQRWLNASLDALQVWPEHSAPGKAVLNAAALARQSAEEAKRAEQQALRATENAQRDEQRRAREQVAAAEKAKSKPRCTNVVMSGFIASSVMDLDALHDPKIPPSHREDVLARHPYRCQINSFGIAYGCRGAAYVSGRNATVKDWDPTYYLIEMPLDFNIGRRDAPAYVLRSEAKCRS